MITIIVISRLENLRTEVLPYGKVVPAYGTVKPPFGGSAFWYGETSLVVLTGFQKNIIYNKYKYIVFIPVLL